MKKPMKIGFIGNGWRTRGYWRIVHQVPEEFEISGVLFRNPEKAAVYNETYPGKAYTDLDTFLAQDHDMIFLLLPSAVTLPYIEKVLAAGFPLLLETPPAGSVENLQKLWELNQRFGAKIQVAEQYFLQPYHKAVRALTDRGVLGEVSNVRINMIHDFHGISIMRRLLGESAQSCTIRAQQFSFPVLFHCGRPGMVPGSDSLKNDRRKVASFSFDDGKVGFFDFADEQYFNYFRSRHLNVQGTHGEINDYDVTYWNGTLPVSAPLQRQDTGHDSNLEGHFHRGMIWNGEFLYENPFLAYPENRLTDDEIAMGSLLLGMQRLIEDGTEIYPLKEALDDAYLWQKMEEAIRTGQAVRTEPMSWQK